MTKLSNLRSATNLPQLASVLGIKPSNLTYVLYWLQPEQKYQTFTVMKKRGGRRAISAPQPRLKFIQRRLASVLSDIQIELEERHKRQCILAHGFKKGFSIVTNAKEHRNKRYVFNADLKEFFLSINFGRVYGFFTKDRNFALDPRVATVIAQIACFNNQLPQGSPCSPVISNLIAHVMDKAISDVVVDYKSRKAASVISTVTHLRRV